MRSKWDQNLKNRIAVKAYSKLFPQECIRDHPISMHGNSSLARRSFFFLTTRWNLFDVLNFIKFVSESEVEKMNEVEDVEKEESDHLKDLRISIWIGIAFICSELPCLDHLNKNLAYSPSCHSFMQGMYWCNSIGMVRANPFLRVLNHLPHQLNCLLL